MKKKIRLTESGLANMIHTILRETELPTNENTEFKEALNKGKACKKASDCPPGMECRVGGDGVNGQCRYKDEVKLESVKESKKNTLRLTESELTDLIKNLVTETKRKKSVNEQEYLPTALETGDAILTIVGTTIGLLGIAGYDILKGYAKQLMKAGKKEEAKEMMSAIKDMKSNDNAGDVKEMEMNEADVCISCCNNPDGCPSYWRRKCSPCPGQGGETVKVPPVRF
jgi:hypothetical protein